MIQVKNQTNRKEILFMEADKDTQRHIKKQKHSIYGCRSIHPAKWVAPFVIWRASDAVRLRVDQADHLDDCYYGGGD